MEFNEDAIRYVRARVPEVAICGVNQREDPTSEIAKFDLVTRFICFWFGTQGSDGFWSQTGSRRLWEPSVRPRKNIIRIGTAARTCPRTCYLLQESKPQGRLSRCRASLPVRQVLSRWWVARHLSGIMR